MELNQKPIIFLKIPEILQKQKNYRPVSLMNIDVKIHNKFLAYLIQQYIKRRLQTSGVYLTYTNTFENQLI